MDLNLVKNESQEMDPTLVKSKPQEMDFEDVGPDSDDSMETVFGVDQISSPNWFESELDPKKDGTRNWSLIRLTSGIISADEMPEAEPIQCSTFVIDKSILNYYTCNLLGRVRPKRLVFKTPLRSCESDLCLDFVNEIDLSCMKMDKTDFSYRHKIITTYLELFRRSRVRKIYLPCYEYRWPEFFQPHRHLNTLVFSDRKPRPADLTTISVNQLLSEEQWKKVKEIEINGEDVPLDPMFLGNTQLKTLILCFDSPGSQFLDMIRGCPCLSRLILKKCDWSTDMLLCENPVVSEVSSLTLVEGNIDEPCLESLMSIFPKLTKLHIRHCSWYDNKAHEKVCQIQTGLKSLQLYDCGFNDEGLKYTFSLENLKTLDVRNAMISDHAARYCMMRMRNLSRIMIRKNRAKKNLREDSDSDSDSD